MPRLVDRFISPAVGLASEAYAHHKNKSKSRSPSPNPPQHSSSQSQPSDPNLSEDPDYESDSEAWELDDAASETKSPASSGLSIPKGNWAGPASIEQIADAFLAAFPLKNDANAGGKLRLPVVIPQKRPQSKARGFVRAYAPVLEECGIGEDMWLGFLDCFMESLKVHDLALLFNNRLPNASTVSPAVFLPSVLLTTVSASVPELPSYT